MLFLLIVVNQKRMVLCPNGKLSDAGGPARPNPQARLTARIRSSDFVGHISIHLSLRESVKRVWNQIRSGGLDVRLKSTLVAEVVRLLDTSWTMNSPF
jgi:hypothetical protein